MRNLESRIEKLEARRTRADEVLIVWRQPDGDVAQALINVRFGAGDRIICAEWYGSGPLPKPKWSPNLRLKITGEEDASLERSLRNIIDAGRKPRGLLPTPRPLPYPPEKMTDGDLWWFALGART